MALPDSLLGVVVGSSITATVTLAVSAIQYWAQAHREVMLRRQKWIETLVERIPEILDTAGWFYLSKMKDTSGGGDWNAEKTINTLKLSHQIFQIELMLDFDNKAHVALRHSMNEVRATAFASDVVQLTKFDAAVDNLKAASSAVLKEESARVSSKAW